VLSEYLRELSSEISVVNFQLGGCLLLERRANSASLFKFIRLVQLHVREEARSFGEFAYLNMDFLGMCIHSAMNIIAEFEGNVGFTSFLKMNLLSQSFLADIQSYFVLVSCCSLQFAQNQTVSENA
jgi:hypothetical protein